VNTVAREAADVIVVGTDGSACAKVAVREALELARAGGDRVVLVTAWRELSGDFGIPYDSLFPSLQLADIEREWADETLAAAAAEAVQAGVEVETVRRHGNPAAEICAVARERAARLIVVGSNGWGPVERIIFGSVSAGVVNHAPCPVLVVPEPVGAEDESSHEAASDEPTDALEFAEIRRNLAPVGRCTAEAST
jgi:nucleotide-binding universal stress UspA family protein